MKIPFLGEFVTKALHDSTVEFFRHALTIAQEEKRDLMEKYHALRIERSANPRVLPTDAEIQAIEAAHGYDEMEIEIEQAIDDRAQGDPSLTRMLQEDARRMRARGIEPEEIAERILAGAINDD
jgi:DNA-directed RNA polymerase subunit H (RpoH/RPB5)